MTTRTPTRGRPRGRRNRDYEATRDALLAAVRRELMHLAHPSIRDLAVAAGVSVPTLRHYFPTREALLADVLVDAEKSGLPFLHLVAAGPLQDTLHASLEWFVDLLSIGLSRGVESVHAFSLTEGIGNASVGPAYVNHVLEPSLQSLEARLARHVARGDMKPCDLRHAALFLVSPLLLARLHQGSLGGARCRKLDERALAMDLVDRFVAAYGRPLGDR